MTSGEIGAGSPSLLRASLARSGKWAGGVGVVGGFIADILAPLAPFAAYIALTAAVAALVLATAIAFRLVLAARALPALVFASTTAAIAGGVYALQQATAEEDGLLAGLVPAVAELQQSLGIVSARVERIEQTVTDTQQTVKEVQQTAESVEKKTDEIAAGQQLQAEQTEQLQATTQEIARSIETIAEGFASLAAQGGLIADPRRPDEFYHNARVHELSGDMLNARRSYLAFANFDVDAIDPYLRFATLLRVQDGRAGAREVFGTLAEKGKALSIKLVHALQFEDAQRPGRIETFLRENPGFAPAHYLQALEYSQDRLGTQSLADKRAEAQALTAFLSHEKDGGLLTYFVDQTELAAWVDRSQRRLATLGDVLDPARSAPTIVPQRSNQGWMVTVSLPEPATGLSWRLGRDGPFTDTGFQSFNDQTTGKPMPNLSFAVPDDVTADVIGLKYLDIRGRETGPFEVRFDPKAALAEGNKQIMEQFWTSWIAFDASGNTGLVYYTQMLSYRCAIAAVRYSLNGDALDRTLDMPPCDEKDPYALPDGFLPYFKVGPEVSSMSVQVTYVDGSVSPLRVFKR